MNVTKIVTDDAGGKAVLGVRSLRWYKGDPRCGWKAKSPVRKGIPAERGTVLRWGREGRKTEYIGTPRTSLLSRWTPHLLGHSFIYPFHQYSLPSVELHAWGEKLGSFITLLHNGLCQAEISMKVWNLPEGVLAYCIPFPGFWITEIWYLFPRDRGFPGGSAVKNLAAMQETQVRSLVWEDPLEESMTTYSSILAWRIPWTEEPGGLPPTGSQRVRHDWGTEHAGTSETHWNFPKALRESMNPTLWVQTLNLHHIAFFGNVMWDPPLSKGVPCFSSPAKFQTLNSSSLCFSQLCQRSEGLQLASSFWKSHCFRQCRGSDGWRSKNAFSGLACKPLMFLLSHIVSVETLVRADSGNSFKMHKCWVCVFNGFKQFKQFRNN